MPTNRIPPSSSMVETLRLIAKDRAREGGRSSENTTTVKGKHDMQALRQRLRALALDIDPADEIAMRQLRNGAVHEIILWEFGNEFRTDSQFMPMLESICHTIEADPGMQQRFASLVLDLRKAD